MGRPASAGLPFFVLEADVKIKYYREDGTEEIVEMDTGTDGTLILPKDLVIPCGCSHSLTSTKGRETLWPAALLFSVAIASVSAIAWKLLEIISA
jgi:hypothetical protein